MCQIRESKYSNFEFKEIRVKIYNLKIELNYRKTLCSVPSKRQQFCKIHEGTGQWVQILLKFFTKK